MLVVKRTSNGFRDAQDQEKAHKEGLFARQKHEISARASGAEVEAEGRQAFSGHGQIENARARESRAAHAQNSGPHELAREGYASESTGSRDHDFAAAAEAASAASRAAAVANAARARICG
jgi:hypothetical protein